jgi:hypothetical protein
MVPASPATPPTAPVTTAPADRPLNTALAAFWIGLFSFREMVRRRRLIFLSLVILMPVAATLMWRWLDKDGLISPALWMANLGGLVYVHFLVALVSLAVGLSAIGEQVSEGTIIYYWTRPLARSAIYLGRLVAAQLVAAVLLATSLALCFLVITLGNLQALSFDFLKLYLGNCLVVMVGALVYTAIFACVGTWLQRPMLVAVLYAFGWESISGHVPLRIQEMTVVFHLRNMIQNETQGTHSVPNLLLELKRALLGGQTIPEWQSALTLVAVMVVFTLLGIWLLRNKEIFR